MRCWRVRVLMLVLLLCAGASAAGVCVSVLVLNAGTCAGAGAAGVRTGAVAVRGDDGGNGGRAMTTWERGQQFDSLHGVLVLLMLW